MASLIEKLTQQFLPENRYSVFGAVLLGLDIRGIKGTNCRITFDFPVTAIAGYNGAGKSTIAQIALCMYRAVDGDSKNKRKYLKDFFVKTLLDKSPYLADARIEAIYAAGKETGRPVQFRFFEDDDSIKCIKKTEVYYSTDRWAGYKHQPPKTVYYYGMSYFIPYQEQNSNLLRDGSANVTQTIRFSNEIIRIVADILSIQYTELHNNDISNNRRTEHVISASKVATSYSENHMGCGEGRLLKLVYALETATNGSLFVIEEPETALHQLAQYKLAQYFLDVCYRKHHQIIFTTHSPDIQRALPQQARKYITRGDDGTTTVVNSPSIAEIENHFSGGVVKKMTVVTEDEIGKILIMEILRQYAPKIFVNCAFFAMNLNFEEVKKYVFHSQQCGIKIFGVVDENRRADVSKYVIAFPEETPPELSILGDEPTAAQLMDEFCFRKCDLPDDHHRYFEVIASKRVEDLTYVKNRCVKLYVENKGQEYYKDVIEQMRLWLSECN